MFAVGVSQPRSPKGINGSLWRLLFALLAFVSFEACGHGVAEGDQAFIESSTAPQINPFVYLGAKHMVTGYDHLLFLFGVIFFLYRLKEVGIYVTLFALGHSTTLLFGVLSGTHINPYIIDAIIGLSVVYKALDNLGAFQRMGYQPNTKVAVLIFGLFHGFGLATKLQDFTLSRDGLITNMVSFNVGVEIGQMIALGMILIAISFWRRSDAFERHAVRANTLLMAAGLILFGYQLAGYFAAPLTI